MNDKPSKDQKEKSDLALWAYVTRDVIPLDVESEFKNMLQVEKTIKQPPHKKSVAVRRNTVDIAPLKNVKKGNDLDRRTAQRLSRGQLAIEGRLDLHGMTQHQAYDALLRFIPSGYAQGKRCVLIITGKGKHRGSTALIDEKIGVLRQKTPQWLSEPPLEQYVLSVKTARPKDGGEGALYVLLRRVRS